MTRRLAVLDTSLLSSPAHQRLGHTLLSILAHSWVHLDPARPAPALPRPLAVPWARVSQLLGVPPVVIHSTMSLSNWRLRDPSGPFTLDNLATIHSFDSTRDLEVGSILSVQGLVVMEVFSDLKRWKNQS